MNSNSNKLESKFSKLAYLYNSMSRQTMSNYSKTVELDKLKLNLKRLNNYLCLLAIHKELFILMKSS